MNIALIPMAAKPLHAGHYELIKIAAKENDQVILFVSSADRKRPGEVTILGADMMTIWKRFIQPTLPSNVEIDYTGIPIRSLWEVLGDANESESDDTYVLYGDIEDISANYPESSLKRYTGWLYDNGQIRLEPISRKSTIDVSGTKMRKWIEDDNEEQFIYHLPQPIQSHGHQIFNLLKSHAIFTPKKKKKIAKKK